MPEGNRKEKKWGNQNFFVNPWSSHSDKSFTASSESELRSTGLHMWQDWTVSCEQSRLIWKLVLVEKQQCERKCSTWSNEQYWFQAKSTDQEICTAHKNPLYWLCSSDPNGSHYFQTYKPQAESSVNQGAYYYMGHRAQTCIRFQHADNVFYLKQILKTQCHPTQEEKQQIEYTTLLYLKVALYLKANCTYRQSKIC